MKEARKLLPSDWFSHKHLILVDEQYEALSDVDAMVLVTEWKPFRQPDFDKIRGLMRSPVIFDGRNQYDPAKLKKEGFEYHGIGRC